MTTKSPTIEVALSNLIVLVSIIQEKQEKSTLWTDADIDQNFQRDLGAIGPYEFQGNSHEPMTPLPCRQGNSYGPMVLKVRPKFPPRLVLDHGWLFPETSVFGRLSSLATNQRK